MSPHVDTHVPTRTQTCNVLTTSAARGPGPGACGDTSAGLRLKPDVQRQYAPGTQTPEGGPRGWRGEEAQAGLGVPLIELLNAPPRPCAPESPGRGRGWGQLGKASLRPEHKVRSPRRRSCCGSRRAGAPSGPAAGAGAPGPEGPGSSGRRGRPCRARAERPGGLDRPPAGMPGKEAQVRLCFPDPALPRLRPLCSPVLTLARAWGWGLARGVWALLTDLAE